MHEQDLISFYDLQKLIPLKPNGQPIKVASLVRWASRGVNGVKLKTVRVGRRLMTTRADLAAFYKEARAVDLAQQA